LDPCYQKTLNRHQLYMKRYIVYFLGITVFHACTKPNDDPNNPNNPPPPVVPNHKFKTVKRLSLSGDTLWSVTTWQFDNTGEDTVSFTEKDTLTYDWSHSYSIRKRTNTYDPTSKKVTSITSDPVSTGAWNNFVPIKFDIKLDYAKTEWVLLKTTYQYYPPGGGAPRKSEYTTYDRHTVDTTFPGYAWLSYTNMDVWPNYDEGRIEALYATDGRYVWSTECHLLYTLAEKYFDTHIPGLSHKKYTQYRYFFNQNKVCTTFIVSNGEAYYTPRSTNPPYTATGTEMPVVERKIDYTYGDAAAWALEPLFSNLFLPGNTAALRVKMRDAMGLDGYDLFNLYGDLSTGYTDSLFRYTNNVRQLVRVEKHTNTFSKDQNGRIISIKQQSDKNPLYVKEYRIEYRD
jgi:hypothetical protein